MKKFWIVMFVAAFLCTGCSSSPSYDEAKLKQKSEELVTYMSNMEIEKVYKQLDASLTSEFTVDDMTSTFAKHRESLGEVKSINTDTIKYEDGNAICFPVVEYEQGQLEFQIAFDSEMRIIGYYMR